MIPIQLNIKGLKSYQEQQNINFSQLTNARLFGIFGKVGSGKSTILEAMMLALFNKSPQLGSTNMKYNAMNLKVKELLIEFEFSNHENKVFKAVLQTKRNSKRFEQISPPKHQIYQKNEAGAFEPTNASIDDILGLSFDEFKRTTIIPQGMFKEFLELKPKDRTEMLERIFRLERFDLSKPTRSLLHETDTNLKIEESKLAELQDISTAQLTENEAKLSEAKKKEESLKKELQTAEQRLQQLKEARKLHDERESKSRELQSKTLEWEKIQAHKSVLNRYEKALHNFQSLMEKKAAATEEIQNIETNYRNKSIEEKQLKEKAAKVNTAFEKVKADYQNLEAKQQEVRDLQNWVDILATDKELAFYQKKQKEGEAKLEKIHAEAAEKNKALEAAKKERTAALAEREQEAVFSRKVAIFEALNTKKEALQSTEKQLKTVNAKVEKLTQNFLNQVQKALPEAHSVDEKLKSALSDLAQNQQKHLEACRQELQQHKVQQEISRYANHLADGSPCPLCGSEHHPNPQTKDLSQETKAAKAAEKEAQKTLEQTQKWLIEWDSVHKQCVELNAEAVDLKKDHAAKAQAVAELAADEQIQNLDEKAARAGMQEAQKAGRAFKKWEKAIQDLEAQTQKLNEEAEKVKGGLQKVAEKLSANKATAASLKKSLSIIRDLAPSENAESLQKKQEAKSIQIKETKQQHEKLSLEKENMARQLTEVQTKMSEMIERGKLVREKLKQIDGQLSEKLAASDFSDEAEVKKVLKQNLALSEERTQVEKFEQMYYNLKSRVAELNRLLANNAFTLEKYQKTESACQELKNQIEKQQYTIAQTEQLIVDLKIKLDKKKVSEEKQAKLEIRKAHLDTLSRLFGGKAFVNYASGSYLRNLCHNANERFMRLTHQQLSLTVGQDNEIEVLDRLNNGKTRSIQSLSGGQLFQASLCLALALSDNIGQIKRSDKRFFFMDEGFGALDTDSLAGVVKALKDLRKENRIIGIISHVESLQQELDCYLKVENTETKGSKVSPQV